MKLNILLRSGVVTALLLMTLLPLMAFDFAKTNPNFTSEPELCIDAIETVATIESSDIAVAKTATPVAVTSDLGPALLTASYKGHSGCSPTNHDFEIVVDVLDAANNLYRVRNLLDEGQVVKAKLKDGKLDMGRQKMGSYAVTGEINYLENPARLETRIKYDDGVGFCDDVSVFVKR